MASHTPQKPCPRCGVMRQARATSWCRDCRQVRASDNAWMSKAACRNDHYDPEWFWPLTTDNESAQRALAICVTCPVTDECLQFALANNETAGVWGGTTPSQRQALRLYARKSGVSVLDLKMPRPYGLETA